MKERSGIWFSLLVVIVAAPGIYFLVKYFGKSHSQSTDMNTKFNVVVSQRGDGNFNTISEAIQAAPSNSPDRFFVRVCSGVYNEVVVVPPSKKNIVLIGDGAEVTRITASRHVPDFSTSDSATFTVYGDGFIAQGITFENTAGNEPNLSEAQAVALMCSANHTIFYKCKFIGYHDTLYAKEGTQFYRDCDIFGTVDFIFGFATAVFQNCNLYARRTDFLKVTFTAQGRQTLAQNCAFTLQGCKFTTAPEVDPTAGISGFLGRPWFSYSTVMVMESYLDRVVSPSGWEEWPETPVTNAVYLEYKNWGPGADTSGRVQWPGYKVIHDAKEAIPYTASVLIQGDEWIPATGVPYSSGFMSKS